ncbi:MAG: response regulator [Bacteroidota bacterium]
MSKLNDMEVNGTILLVDDEPNILRALKFLFSQKGFHVLTASNGTEGIIKARTHKPNIIILDVMMPGMDGFEVAKLVRKEKSLHHCTIVFLTAKGTNQDQAQGYANGGEIYLTKPFDNQELVNIVMEVFEFG